MSSDRLDGGWRSWVSAFGGPKKVRPRWLTVPYEFLEAQRPDAIPLLEDAAGRDIFTFYSLRSPPTFKCEPVRVELDYQEHKASLPPLVLAAALALRPEPPVKAAFPSAADLKKLQECPVSRGWQLLAGPHLLWEPRWVRSSEACWYFARLVQMCGADNVLGVAWEDAGEGVACGIVSTDTVAHLWELSLPFDPIEASRDPSFRPGDRVELIFEGVPAVGTVLSLGRAAASVVVDNDDGDDINDGVDCGGGGSVARIPTRALRPAASGRREVVTLTDEGFQAFFKGMSVVVVCPNFSSSRGAGEPTPLALKRPASEPLIKVMTCAAPEIKMMSKRPSTLGRMSTTPHFRRKSQTAKTALGASMPNPKALHGALFENRERAGLLTLARAQGCLFEDRVKALLDRGDVLGAKKLIFRTSKKAAKKESSAKVNPLSRTRTMSLMQHEDRFEAHRDEEVGELTVLGIKLKDLGLEPEPFAQGGGGAIFRGTFKGEDIIAKCMLTGADKAQADEELCNEVTTLASLKHANIIKVFGVAEGAEGKWFLIEHFANQGDLSGMIKSDAFSPATFATLASEVLSAVAFIHGMGMAHLDLKLENVLISNGEAKVADFGTSAGGSSEGACSNQGEALRDASTHMFVGQSLMMRHRALPLVFSSGTLPYMPPENMSEEEVKGATGAAWDVYSLAVLLWAMAHRKRPWAEKAHTPTKIFRLVTKGKRPPFADDGEQPAPLKDIVESMWHQDPAKRSPLTVVSPRFNSEVIPPLATATSTADWGRPWPLLQAEQPLANSGAISSTSGHNPRPFASQEEARFLQKSMKAVSFVTQS